MYRILLSDSEMTNLRENQDPSFVKGLLIGRATQMLGMQVEEFQKPTVGIQDSLTPENNV